MYPLLTLGVLAIAAAIDRLSGRGLSNGLGGVFGGDFLGFYTAGHWVASGQPRALTSQESQLAFQTRVLGEAADGVAHWVSPPYFAWFFAPLASLPYVPAYLAFVTGSVIVLFFAARALSRELALDVGPARMLGVGIQYYPAVQWLLNGQLTGLWLAAFVGIFILLRRGHDARAGLVLGCFACKPTLALGLAVALLAARRFRALAAAAVLALSLVAVGFATLPEAMRDYLHHGSELVALVRSDSYNTAGLHGSFELGTLLFDGVSPALGSAAGVAATTFLLGSIAALWLRARERPGTPAWDLRMAATLALGVIASPHLFVYDLTLLILPLFIVVAHTPAEHERPLAGGPLLGLTALVWALGLAGPALTVLQQELSRRVLGFPMALQVGGLAIFAWALAVGRRAEAQSCHSRPAATRATV